MSSPIIGGLNEKSLHRQLKEHYQSDESQLEQKVDGYVIDIVNPGELVEIQTGNFSAIKKKLSALLPNHKIRLVHPIAVETVINVLNEDGSIASRRRSPKRGSIYSAASQLLYIADFLESPNLSVELSIIKQEEIRRDNGKGARRRHGISIEERILTEVLDTIRFHSLENYLVLLPEGLPYEFGTRELAEKLPSTGTGTKGKLKLAGQISWLLRRIGLLEESGKDGNRILLKLPNSD